MKTVKITKLVFSALIASIVIYGVSFVRPQRLEGANLLNVKDTLSSSQLSYFGRLSVGQTAGDTVITVGQTAPFTTNANLFVGDTIAIGQGGTTALTSYVVNELYNTNQIGIVAPLAAANIAANNAVIATRTAIHSVTFTPQNSFVNGIFEFLVKASSVAGKQQDGIPDADGFDLGMDVGSTTAGPGTRLGTSDVTCPFGAAAGVGTTTVISSSTYHVITCTLSGGATNPLTAATLTIGSSTSALINPTAANGHTPGQASSAADVYTFFLRHKDASGTVIDSSQGKIAMVEAVRVTATVDPTLTFAISDTGVGTGSTLCGNTLGANADNVTATAVPFGSLNIGSFNDLAQHLSAVTNAYGGYVVTVYENSAMRNIENPAITIADTNCDGACTIDTAAAWTNSSSSEWGYSLHNINTTTLAFTHTNGYKAFGVGAANAKTIMSNTSTPASTEAAWICYRLTASTTQAAGNYENKLIFTATATF